MKEDNTKWLPKKLSKFNLVDHEREGMPYQVKKEKNITEIQHERKGETMEVVRKSKEFNKVYHGSEGKVAFCQVGKANQLKNTTREEGMKEENRRRR